MQSSLRKLSVTLPLSLLFASACFAQTAAIQGDVKGEDGKPLAGAVVKIERVDIKQNFSVKTDKKGHYYYGGLGVSGTFNITIEVDGKVVDALRGVKPVGAQTTDVNFDVKADMAKAAAAAAAANPAAAGAAAAASGVPVPDVERGMTPAQKAAYEQKKKETEEALAKKKELNDSFNAGMEAEGNKQYDTAIEQFEKAAAVDPNQHVVWSHLGDNYSSRSDKETGDAKQADIDKAAADYKKAIDMQPQDAAYHNNYALILVKEQKIDDAQKELSQAATLDPTAAGKYYYNLGAVLANKNQTEPAGEAFKKSMAGGYVEAYYQYALILVNKATTTPDGKIVPAEGTIEALQKYLELAPTGPNAPAAKDLLTTLGGGIQTSFEKPGQKAPANTKKGK